MDGKRVRVERLTPAGWKLLQTVVVESEGYGSRAEKDKLRFKVPKGTTIRAVLPRAQTGPCLLAGYSNLCGHEASSRSSFYSVPAPRWRASPRPQSSPTA